MAVMSSDEGAVAWLRDQIEVRKAVAEAATCAPWEAEGDDPTDDEVWIDVDGQPWRLVILRGPESHENMLHVAANDPRDTIARCEAELAILDEHRVVLADPGYPEQGQSYGSRREYRIVSEHPAPEDIRRAGATWCLVHCRSCRVSFPCRTVRLLASGYKHRPGYPAELAAETR